MFDSLINPENRLRCEKENKSHSFSKIGKSKISFERRRSIYFLCSEIAFPVDVVSQWEIAEFTQSNFLFTFIRFNTPNKKKQFMLKFE